MEKIWVTVNRAFNDTRVGSGHKGQRLLLPLGVVLQLEEFGFVTRDPSFNHPASPPNRSNVATDAGLAKSPASLPAAPASQPKTASLSAAAAGAPSSRTTPTAAPPGPTRSTRQTSSGGNTTSKPSASRTSKASSGRSAVTPPAASVSTTSARRTGRASARTA